MQFEKWIRVDIDKGRAASVDIGPCLFTGDVNSLKLGMEVVSGTDPVTVTGTVTGHAILSNGATTAPVTGEISGNRAWIVLPSSALVLRGKIEIFIRVTDGSDTAVALYASGFVLRSETETIYDPDDEIPNVGQIQQAAQVALGAAASATSAAAAAVGNFAPAFDQATANDAGSYVTYTDGKMYYLPNGHTADTTWADTTKNEVTAGGELTDLKGASETAHGGEVIQLAWVSANNGYYINTTGTTVDISSPVSSTNMTYAVYDCTPGELFSGFGKSPGNSAHWMCFIDGEGNRLEVEGLTSSMTLFVAPAGAAKIIIQKDKRSGSQAERNNTIYRGGITTAMFDYLMAQINALRPASLMSMSPLMSTAPTTEPENLTDGEGENTDAER